MPREWLFAILGYLVVVAVVAAIAWRRGSSPRSPRRARCDRQAALVLAGVGLSVAGAMAVALAAGFATVLADGTGTLAERLASLFAGTSHEADDWWFFVVLAGFPILVAGVLALVPAWRLWRGRSGGGTLAFLWLAPALVLALGILATQGPGGLWFPFSLAVPCVLCGAALVVGFLTAGAVAPDRPRFDPSEARLGRGGRNEARTHL